MDSSNIQCGRVYSVYNGLHDDDDLVFYVSLNIIYSETVTVFTICIPTDRLEQTV